MPGDLQIVSFFFASYGALWFVIPSEMIAIKRAIFCCQCKRKEDKILDSIERRNDKDELN